jgi:TolA-binding protein
MKVSELHPEEALDLYEAGGLGPRELAALKAHLARCASCAAHVQWRSDVVQARLADSGVDGAEARRLAAAALASQGILAPVQAEPQPRAMGRRRVAVAAVIIATSLVSAVASAKFWPSIERAWQRLSAPARPARPQLPPRTALQSVPAPDDQEPPPSSPPVRPAPAAPRQPLALRPRVISPSRHPRQALEDLAAPSAPAPGPNLPAQAPPPSPLEAPASQGSLPSPPPVSAARLFADVTQARRAGWLTDARLAYGELVARFPGSREERAAGVLLGQLTLERGEVGDAPARFERYLGTDPNGALAEEARLGRALALEQLGQREHARRAWQDLLEKHPRSVHAGRARARLESLQSRPPALQDTPP